MHAVIAVVIQGFFGFLTGNWVIGGLLAVGIFIGREHAQAEYRWIEHFGGGKRANMPWYGGFDLRVWSAKSLADFLLPAIAVAILA